MSRFSFIKMMSSLIVLLSLFMWGRQANASVVSLVEDPSKKELVISYDIQPIMNAEPGLTIISDSFVLRNTLNQSVKFYLTPSLVLEKELDNKVFFSIKRLASSEEMIVEKSNSSQELVIGENAQEKFQLSVFFDGNLLENDSQNKTGQLLLKIIAEEMTTKEAISVEKSGDTITGYTKKLPKTNEKNRNLSFFVGMILGCLSIGMIIKRKLWLSFNERRYDETT